MSTSSIRLATRRRPTAVHLNRVASGAVAVTAGQLFADNFEGYSVGAPLAGNWTYGSGTWDVLNDGSKVAHSTASGVTSVNAPGASGWTNYRVTASVKAPTGGYAKVVARY